MQPPRTWVENLSSYFRFHSRFSKDWALASAVTSNTLVAHLRVPFSRIKRGRQGAAIYAARESAQSDVRQNILQLSLTPRVVLWRCA